MEDVLEGKSKTGVISDSLLLTAVKEGHGNMRPFIPSCIPAPLLQLSEGPAAAAVVAIVAFWSQVPVLGWQLQGCALGMVLYCSRNLSKWLALPVFWIFLST